MDGIEEEDGHDREEEHRMIARKMPESESLECQR
jgi:hypothetical protein